MFQAMDRSAHAQNVSRWIDLGVELPEALAEAIKVFELVLYAEVGHGHSVDITKITPENVEEAIRDLAEYKVKGERPQVGQLSVLEKAKQDLLDLAARQVLYQAGAGVPDVIEQLGSEFDRHAKAYVTAVKRIYRKLPTGGVSTLNLRASKLAPALTRLTSDSLVEAGGQTVSAYAAAQEHAAYLNRVSEWVVGTNVLPGHMTQPDLALTILRPKIGAPVHRRDQNLYAVNEELALLDAANELAHSGKSNPTLDSLNPVLVAAALKEISFGINTLGQADELRRSSEDAQARERSRWQMATHVA